MIILLSASLLLSVGFIIYQNFIRDRSKLPQATLAQNGAGGNFSGVLNSFLVSLPKADATTKDAHERLIEYLSSLDAKTFPATQELRQFASTKDIPYDYAFFLKECLPKYSDSLKNGGVSFKDQNILLSIPA